MTTLIWCSGIEYGVNPTASGAGLWDEIGGSPTASTTVKHSGTYSLKINPSSGVAYVGRYYTAGIFVMVAYFYFSTLPNTTTDLMGVYGNDGEFNAIIYDSSDGKFHAASSAGGSDAVGPSVSTGVWYRIDTKSVFNSTTHTVDWKVNGAAQTQFTFASRTNENAVAYYLGSSGSCSTNYYIDDIAVSVTSGDFPIGPGVVYGISPSADGTHNAGTNIMERQDGQDIGAVTAYDLINSVPIGNTSTYIRQLDNGTGNYAEVQLADISANVHSVVGAHAVMAYYSASTSANSAQARVRDGAGAETTIYNGDMSESSVFYKSIQVTTPAAGWSTTTVNALRIRCGYASDANPDPYWVDFMVEVYATGLDLTMATATLASSGVTASVSVGSAAISINVSTATLSGTAVALKVQRGIACATGSLTAGAQALKVQRPVTLSTGTLAGTAQDLLISRGVALTTGELTITGQSLRIQRPVAMGTGSLTAGGQALAVQRPVVMGTGELASAAQGLLISRGVALLTGNLVSAAQGLLVSRGVALLTGSLTAGGQGLLVQRPVALTTGEMIATGQALLVMRPVALSTGNLVMSGQGLRVQRPVILGTGSLTASAISITVTVGETAITVTLSGATLTGTGQGLLVSRGVALGTGNLAASGQGLLVSRGIALLSAILAGSGQGLLANHGIPLLTGEVSSHGQNLALARNLVMGYAELASSAGAITIERSLAVALQSATLASDALTLAILLTLAQRIEIDDQAWVRTGASDSLGILVTASDGTVMRTGLSDVTSILSSLGESVSILREHEEDIHA